MKDNTTPAAPRKAYFLFLGDSVSALDNKTNRFVVETAYPMTSETHFSGTVVARARNSAHPLGETSDKWCSPIGDIKNGLFSSFVRVPRYYVEEKFPDNIMSDENL
jgi:hypothetical protein